MRAGILRRRVIRASSDRRDHRRARTAGESYGADSNCTGAALYQYGPSFDGTRKGAHTDAPGARHFSLSIPGILLI